MKLALQIHPTRISDELLADRINPVLNKLALESYLLPRRHDGNVELQEGTAAIVALGGDGTFLHGARVAAINDLPIIGVNIGRLGFLCSAEISDLFEVLADIKHGRMPLEERHVLQGEVRYEKQVKFSQVALNDIVIYRSEFDTLRDLEAYDNGQLIAHYRADGIIMATALGSTAYNMSAGGPLVHPSLEVAILTPICAHSLLTKPLVLSPKNTITISAHASSCPMTVSFDGEVHGKLEIGDELVVSSYHNKLKLYRPERYDFYEVLREKFQHGYVFKDEDVQS